jgi:hypothetical protein
MQVYFLFCKSAPPFQDCGSVNPSKASVPQRPVGGPDNSRDIEGQLEWLLFLATVADTVAGAGLDGVVPVWTATP